MTDSFVTGLRARASALVLTKDESSAITIRVEMPEVWDVVRIVVAPTEPALSVKVAALGALFPEADMHQDFVLKLHGWEVLDEAATLAEIGVVNGSILLLTHRRRRPVK